MVEVLPPWIWLILITISVRPTSQLCDEMTSHWAVECIQLTSHLTMGASWTSSSSSSMTLHLRSDMRLALEVFLSRVAPDGWNTAAGSIEGSPTGGGGGGVGRCTFSRPGGGFNLPNSSCSCCNSFWRKDNKIYSTITFPNTKILKFNQEDTISFSAFISKYNVYAKVTCSACVSIVSAMYYCAKQRLATEAWQTSKY